MLFGIGKIPTFVLITVLYCEFLADYVKLWNCEWPQFSQDKQAEREEPLHAMILADPHLLGPIKGHWLDKMYREWHMRNAFQAALFLQRPDVVFILGDLFDEGDMVDQHHFQKYVQNFHKLFHASPSVPIISVAGNHDIGFHYKMQPILTERFEESFNGTDVNLYTIRRNHFIMINSMSLENDGCHYCKETKEKLRIIKEKLNCLKDLAQCKDVEVIKRHQLYSRPVILQHFPTFRQSDESCTEHDSPELETYRPRWEVLSEQATDWLGKLLEPRLALSGHSHHYCRIMNRWGVEEYTVASFNWRNKIDPSYVMLSITPAKYGILKCEMLEQNAVMRVYHFMLIMCPLLFFWDMLRKLTNYLYPKKSKVKKH